MILMNLPHNVLLAINNKMENMESLLNMVSKSSKKIFIALII
jgi:hypothetical protein